MIQKGRREPEYDICLNSINLILGTKDYYYLSQISIAKVMMKMVLLINPYLNKSLWEARMSIARKNNKESHIP